MKSSLEDTIESQQKVIEFLRARYERDTGRELALPISLGTLLGDPSIQGGPSNIDEEEEKKHAEELEGLQKNERDSRKAQRNAFKTLTFMEAIESLNLPKPEVQPKGGRRGNARKEIRFQPHHMIQTIDLSGFKDRRISRSGLRELLDGLEMMPCIRSLNLSGNGITDDFDKEVLALFDMPKIKAIDLSFNHLKQLGLQIGKKLRDEVFHIAWLDMTMNDFDNETQTVNTLVAGVKKQLRIIYVGLTVQGNQSDQLVRVMQPKKPPSSISLNMRNSRLTKNCFDFLGRCMQSADYSLTALNLKFCFLTFDQIKKLADSLRFNKTLIKLDLSNNGLRSRVANYLMESLSVNNYISEVNFHGNQLNDDFAEVLANLLKQNQVLHSVDISANPISPVGARLILQAISEFNDTLGNLGDLDQTTFMGVRIREELRQAIKLNNASHDNKQAHLKDGMAHVRTNNIDSAKQQDDGTAAMSGQAAAAYPLLKPITFTNIVQDDYLESGVWQLK